MKVFLFLLALATLFTFAAPNAISEGANMILNLSCNMNTKMTALEGLICYVQEHDAQTLCRNLTTPEVIRQFVLNDVVTQLRSPHFVLEQYP